MSEPKAFASLSSGLLARKGAARPAMRPQGFGQLGSGLEDLGWNDMGFEPPRPAVVPVEAVHAGGEPGHASLINPAAGLSPISPVHQQQAKIVERLTGDEGEEEIDETAELVDESAPPIAEVVAMPRAAPSQPVATVAAAAPAPRRSIRTRAAPGSKGKAAFTLRLDPNRHLKLRLACAVNSESAQQLVTRALDELLASMPELDAMASKAPERAAKKG